MRPIIICGIWLTIISSAVAQTRKTAPPQIHTFDVGRLEISVDGSASIRFGFTSRPIAARTVTVVVVDERLDKPSGNMQIVKTEEGRGGCEGDNSPWWNGVASVPPPQRLYHAFAKDVAVVAVVIYPSVRFARSIPKTQLTQSLLPKNVRLKNVYGAIDLTGDGKPDILITRFCCKDPTASEDECDYVCEDFYQRRNGQWVVVRHVTPC